MTSIVSTIAEDLWASFGVGVVIFTVTLAFTFLIRGISDKAVVGKKSKPKECVLVARGKGSSILTYPTLQNATTHSSVRVVGSGCNTPVGGCRKLRGSPLEDLWEQDRADRRGESTSHRPSQIINEVIEGMREQQNINCLFRALALYDELRVTQDLNMQEAARVSRRCAVDFYTIMVRCAIRAKRHHLVEKIIDDMVEQGIPRSLTFYEGTMKQLAGHKQYRLALAVFDRLAADGLEAPPVSLSCLISFATEAGEFERAIEFFEKLSDITTPSIRAYMTVLRVHSKRQDWPSSLAALRDMQNRGVKLDCIALNIALATGIAADQLEAVKALIAEGDSHTPPISDVVSYNTLIKGFARRGNVDGARRTMSQMRERGLAPNAITFNTAIGISVRAMRCRDAWKLLEEMRATGLPPDKFTCSILVKGVALEPNRQRVEAALSLLLEVIAECDNTLRSTLYHTVLEAASAVVEENAALLAKVFAQMRQHGVKPTASAQRLMAKSSPGAGEQESS